MHYIVRLKPPGYTEAWLFGGFVEGDPDSRLLCTVAASSRSKLIDCAEALWDDGADPDSKLELWWGESADRVAPTPDRVQTTTLSAAVEAAYTASCSRLKLKVAQRSADGELREGR
jgi:hypothetical protein